MKKFFSMILAALLTFAFLPLIASAGACITSSDFLKTRGKSLVNADDEEVILRGTNLGGWMLFEEWFTPVNTASGCAEAYDALIDRFGAEKARELLLTYMRNWITTADIANIARDGYNCVRIPMWYRVFQSDDNGTWYTDAAGNPDFSILDEIVEACHDNGIYAILDLHGVPGYQNNCDHSGKSNSQSFFNIGKTAEKYRQNMVEFWRVLAAHFAGDPTVAAYDILNEPLADVATKSLLLPRAWAFFDDVYKAIRSVDPDHIITIEATWRYTALPNPASYGWENVMYQLHLYDTSDSAFNSAIKESLSSYDVPCFVGEFYPKGKADFDFVLSMFNANSVSWCLWTYKGCNDSWGSHGNWFSRFNNTLPKVDVYNDSAETIAEKWGACLRTDSGNFETTGFQYFVGKFLDGYIDVEAMKAVPGSLNTGWRGTARELSAVTLVFARVRELLDIIASCWTL